MTPWIERGETIRVFCTIYCLETKNLRPVDYAESEILVSQSVNQPTATLVITQKVYPGLSRICIFFLVCVVQLVKFCY